MRWNPLSRLKHALGVAIDWRVRDVLEAERQATVELGKTFASTASHVLDKNDEISRRLDEMEDRLREIEEEKRS